ncbi:MBL fold metallo-hydrolase [Phaeovibrio sulfidiphilus]|uniref:MBL fold metallo-hydrolase n=1 Tax=Phaeovibrio sulfidiphilus TaxID=1220600 RepID=A0A8J6YNB1_9PROT|nr:MBL fold metallo-hydrolase [Phaeovibrio sulfidiphilus]MBE1237655.1 MBL fold metallo-hydrolase [Phaeovibrio sulfidiphilus]
MSLRITVLGCGAAGGVPSLSAGWGACDPSRPENRRLRSSILIEDLDGQGEVRTCVLVDLSPDIRQQLLSRPLERLDGIIVTHGHADHIGGLDEVRELNRIFRCPLSLWAMDDTLDELLSRFAYCFPPFPKTGRWGFWRPLVSPVRVIPPEPFQIGSLEFRPFVQDHGVCTSMGFRVGDFAYSTDLVRLEESTFPILEGVDTWVVAACVPYEGHPTHAGLKTVLGWLERVSPRQGWLTHMTPEMDYATVLEQCPDTVAPAHDGLTFRVGGTDRG